MLDYSELKTNIQKLNDQVFSYLNARNVVAAQQAAEKLEMNTMMLKKHIPTASTPTTCYSLTYLTHLFNTAIGRMSFINLMGYE